MCCAGVIYYVGAGEGRGGGGLALLFLYSWVSGANEKQSGRTIDAFADTKGARNCRDVN